MLLSDVSPISGEAGPRGAKILRQKRRYSPRRAERISDSVFVLTCGKRDISSEHDSQMIDLVTNYSHSLKQLRTATGLKSRKQINCA